MIRSWRGSYPKVFWIRCIKIDLAVFRSDGNKIIIYDEGELKEKTVGELAERAIKEINSLSGD